MIRFDNLRLHNFRCFQDCEISFQSDLTVLVARNGLGKTAVLDAVALALGLFVDTVSGTHSWGGFRKRDIRRVREGEQTVTPPGYIQFEAEAEIDGQQLSWRRWMRNDAKQERTSKSDAKPLIGASQTIHERLQADDGGAPFALPLIAYYGTGRRWQGDTKHSRPNVQVVNERCLGYIDCLNGAANYSMFAEWYEHTFTSLAQSTPVTGIRKANRPEFLLAAVNRAVDRVLEAETGWRGLRWDSDDRQLILEHPVHGQLPLDFLSDGVRNTAALVADVAHRCARLNPHLQDAAKETTGILIIDEVDLHLHPEWQQLMIRMLRDAFPNLQLILSTHSPQILSTIKSEAIRIISVSNGIGNVATPEHQTQGVQSADVLAKVMDVDPRPEVAPAKWLTDYRALVEDGKYDTADAEKLWAQLVDHFRDDHPVLQELQTVRRLQVFKRDNNITQK